MDGAPSLRKYGEYAGRFSATPSPGGYSLNPIIVDDSIVERRGEQAMPFKNRQNMDFGLQQSVYDTVVSMEQFSDIGPADFWDDTTDSRSIRQASRPLD